MMENGPVISRLGYMVRRYVSCRATGAALPRMVLQKGAAITDAVSSSVRPCRRRR